MEIFHDILRFFVTSSIGIGTTYCEYRECGSYTDFSFFWYLCSYLGESLGELRSGDRTRGKCCNIAYTTGHNTSRSTNIMNIGEFLCSFCKFTSRYIFESASYSHYFKYTNRTDSTCESHILNWWDFSL